MDVLEPFTVYLMTIHVYLLLSLSLRLIFLQILPSFVVFAYVVVILRMTRGNPNPPPPPSPPFAEMLTQLTQVVAQLAQQQANQMLHQNNRKSQKDLAKKAQMKIWAGYSGATAGTSGGRNFRPGPEFPDLGPEFPGSMGLPIKYPPISSPRIYLGHSFDDFLHSLVSLLVRLLGPTP